MTTTASTARRAGRPSRTQAAQIQDHILDIAAALFLTEGYGATSIEAVAQRAGISKRTFYSRFKGKADLFAGVVHRLISRLRPADTAHLFDGGSLEEILQRLAQIILHAALAPESLALRRIILAEAERFPELATVLDGKVRGGKPSRALRPAGAGNVRRAYRHI